MLFLKISGSLLLIVCATLLARRLNKRAEAELCELDALLRLLSQIRLEIESFSMPMTRILERLEPSLLISLGYRHERAPSSLEELFSGISFVGARSRELFRKFALDFGGGFRDEELRRLSYYVKLFENERERLASELPAKKKINLTLSVSAALGIVILLI